jgi:hypothetical protein
MGNLTERKMIKIHNNKKYFRKKLTDYRIHLITDCQIE